MKISLIVNTVRLGGLDVLFNSLVNQDFSTAPELGGDYEIILVDGWYTERNFTNRIHIPAKAEHSYYDDTTGWNSGLKVASGELVIFQADYTWLYPKFLSDHWMVYKNFPGYTLSGYLDRYPYPKMKVGPTFQIADVWWSMFQKEFTADRAAGFFSDTEPLYHERKGDIKGDPVGDYWELPGDKFYGALNESIPMAVLKELNGWDERYDGGYGSNDVDLGTRANFIGHKFLVNPDSVNYKLGQPGMANGLIPAKERKKLRTPEDNFNFYQNRIKAIKEGLESVKTPNGWGAWA